MGIAAAILTLAASAFERIATMPGRRCRLLCIAGLLALRSACARACGDRRAVRSVAGPGAGHLQQSGDGRRHRRDRHRHALPRRGRRDRSGHAAHDASARRHPPRDGDHAGDRPESGADGGDLRARSGRRRVGDLHARARQQLHQRPCGRRTERRQALCDEDLREGVRRLLGAGRQERRRSQRRARPDAVPAIRESPAKVRPAARARRRS